MATQCKFTPLTETHLGNLQSMVSPDRISTGVSVLELHASDQSRHPKSQPEVVIWPENRQEVSRIVSYANKYRIPVTCWGSGSSMEGNPIPVCGGIVLDFNRMNRILEIRESAFQADVEPGVIYQDLNQALRHQGLFFPPDPGARATIGGMIANNASGTRTVRYGATKDHVMRLVVITADGQEIQVGTRASKTSSGYDLVHLFVGSEGTLGIVVEATVRLTPLPEAMSAAIAGFESVDQAAQAVFEIMRCGLGPAAMELLDNQCIIRINDAKSLDLAPVPTLFMEYHGPSHAYLSEVLDMAKEICEQTGCIDFRAGLGMDQRDRLLSARHEMGEIIVRSHPDCQMLSLDVAVPITEYPEMITACSREIARIGVPGYTFSHAGDGNVHLVYMGEKGNDAIWDQIDASADRLVAHALSLGGTATGEHGVGIGKRKFMISEHGKSLDWMKQIRDLFDPNGILNPGKMFP